MLLVLINWLVLSLASTLIERVCTPFLGWHGSASPKALLCKVPINSLFTPVMKFDRQVLGLVVRNRVLSFGKISGVQSEFSALPSSSDQNSLHLNFLSNFRKSTKISVRLSFIGATQKFTSQGIKMSMSERKCNKYYAQRGN